MFCSSCGAQVNDGVKFCIRCGAPIAAAQPRPAQTMPMQQPVHAMQPQPQPQMQPAPAAPPSGGLRCPKCRGNNVQVQIVEVGQVTTKKGIGLGGHLNNAARTTTAIATLGVSNLVWKKSRGTNKTKTVNATMAVCQQCGNTWELKKGKFGSAPGSVFR